MAAEQPQPIRTQPRGVLARFGPRLSLPLIAAPMFLVSGTALVTAACRAGVIGAFPTANCRSAEELERWLAAIRADLDAFEQAGGRRAAPFAPNLIVHRSNPRLAADLRTVIAAGAEIVIASVGSPREIVAPLHDAGCLVLADVASMRHAEKAIEAGADGLILLAAGAGGQTGWANPFAFARARAGRAAAAEVWSAGSPTVGRCTQRGHWAAISATWARASSRPWRARQRPPTSAC